MYVIAGTGVLKSHISPNVIIICLISHSLSRGGFAEVAVGSWYNVFWVSVQYFTYDDPAVLSLPPCWPKEKQIFPVFCYTMKKEGRD